MFTRSLLTSRTSKLCSFLALSLLINAPMAMAAMELEGVNISGAEWGESNQPGTPGVHYIYPRDSDVDYFASKG
ncbi:MAG: hypothetical protein KA794_12685, partial [Candidatus Obscuribacter sp.]|nr:hypothetical protein [Candidatus Obscuribacter sp.]